MEFIVERSGSVPARPGLVPGRPGAIRRIAERLLKFGNRRRAAVADNPFSDFPELIEATERELHLLLGRPAYRSPQREQAPYAALRHF